MLHEATQELVGIERHGLVPVIVGVVLVVEGDAAIAQFQQPRVADGDAMRVAGQVLEDLGRSAERRISILPIISVRWQKPSWLVILIIPSPARRFSFSGPRRLLAFAIFGS
jgi:hypothetical protein